MRLAPLSVRELAQAVFTDPDLFPVRRGRSVDAEEGIACQQRVQRERQTRLEHYQTEVSLKGEFEFEERTYGIGGRVDGMFTTDTGVVLEEFKCTGALPEQALAADWGQALIYAGLLAGQDEFSSAQLDVRLVYVEADSDEEGTFSVCLSAAAARATLAFITLCYSVRLERHLRRTRERTQWSRDLPFPFEQFRAGQQAVARRVWRAIEREEQLLLEAPTGSGKSLAVLYPAVRALDDWRQIFFLTARNAGAAAALRAAQQLDANQAQLALVELTAREKICPVEGMPCDASQCTYAAGYFQRAPAAIDELLARRHADRATVAAVAEAHEVCPFELALDTARYVDLIIGDYNYVLDPVVRLQRFIGHSNISLLIDEAHHLAPRVRDMLSVEISRHEVREAMDSNLAGMAKRAASIDRALLKMRREFGSGEHAAGALTGSVNRAVKRFLEASAEADYELFQHPELAPLLFACSRWQRAQEWGVNDFADVATIQGASVVARRICLDPGGYIAARLAEYGPSVRFSGTLTPLSLFQRLHGLDDPAATMQERAPNPFQASQLKVVIVPDVPTYYRQRERSLPELAELIRDVMQARPGRYLIALPSYAYAERLADVLEGRTTTSLLRQRPGMDAESLGELLGAFSTPETPSVALVVVMGGSLGESVDFTGVQLDGVFAVGLGLPPPGLERQLLSAHFDADDKNLGKLVAYTQPALTKILQTTGRLIRGPNDRGLVFLIDARFRSAEVQQFFPSHWHPEVVPARDCVAAAKAFWSDADTSPDSRYNVATP